MSLFQTRKPVNSHVEIPGHTNKYYLNLGMRRVYSSGSWSEKWRRWSQDHGSIDSNGSYLTCSRPYYNGRQGSRGRVYTDMSMANIDLQGIERIQPFDPVNTKYMSKRYLGKYTLRECAHMPTSDFLRLVNSLGSKYPHGREK